MQTKTKSVISASCVDLLEVGIIHSQVAQKLENCWSKRDLPQARRAAKLSSCRSIFCLLSMFIFLSLTRQVSTHPNVFIFPKIPWAWQRVCGCVCVCDVLSLKPVRPLNIFSLIRLFSASVHGPKTESSKTLMTNTWPLDSF